MGGIRCLRLLKTKILAEFDAIALRRQEARAAKDWAAADAARDEATAKGIVLEDGPDGTTWRKA